MTCKMRTETTTFELRSVLGKTFQAHSCIAQPLRMRTGWTRPSQRTIGVAHASGPVIMAGLQYVRSIRWKNSTEAMETGRAVRDDIMQTDDFAEGIRAFVEKRKPQWPSQDR